MTRPLDSPVVEWRELGRFASYEEMLDFIERSGCKQYGRPGLRFSRVAADAPPAPARPPPEPLHDFGPMPRVQLKLPFA